LGSDLVAPIEHPKGICCAAQNRRSSNATLRILRLRQDQRWPEDEIHDGTIISLQVLKAHYDIRTVQGLTGHVDVSPQ